MILMWLGSFVLMMWGLTSFQKNVGLLFANFQKSILENGFSSSLVNMFVQSAAIDVVESSPQRSLYSAMGLLNLRILSVRPAVLMMCLSPLAVIPVLVLSSLFLGFSGFFVLGICSIMLVRFWKSPQVDGVLQALFALGLFLVGAEGLLRNAQIVQTYLSQADLIFFVLDGRFGAVFSLVLVALIMSLFVQFEFWTLVLGMSLLSTGTISFNGAIGILLGERLAMATLFWWRTRGLNQECRRIGGQYALLIAISSLVGFWVAGEARSLFDIGFSLEMGAAQEKTMALLIMFAVIMTMQLIFGLIWGHFAGNSTTDELQDPLYFQPSWIDRGLLSQGQKSWAKEKVQKRLSEIRYHLAGLKSLKEGQVPDHIQVRIKEEERQLAELDL